MLRPVLLAAAAALAPGAAAAQSAVTVDFAEYASPVTTEHQATVGRPVTSGGFDFYSLNGGVLATWGTSAAEDPEGSVNRPANAGGSTALFATFPDYRMDMFVGGSDVLSPTSTFRTFNLYSIDLAHQFAQSYLPTGDALGTVVADFIGIRRGSSELLFQSFALGAPADGVPTLTTFRFGSEWRGLQRVLWFQGSTQGSVYQFTNVRAMVTPEPGTYALLATGLAGVLVVARRRRARA